MEGKSKTAYGLRWLYIDFDSFFASVEQHLNPALRGRPVAVVPVKSESTCAIAASYEAKAYGIKTGTPIWEARRRCPQLQLVMAGHRHYVQMHDAIVKMIEEHCLHISAVCSIDEVACELLGSECAPERAREIALNIKRQLAQRISPHVRCSIGLAPNRFLAKVAGDMEKPDGLTLLEAKDLPGKLLRLKLRDLPGIGPNMERRLNAAGIGDMAALWALDPKEMRALWRSVEGECYWMQLHGMDAPLRLTERSSIGHSRVLDPELRKPVAAREIMRHLVIKAARRLREEEFTARTLWLGVRIKNGAHFVARQSFQASGDTFLFLQAAETLWAQMLRQCRPQLIKKVSVTLNDLLAEALVTPDLFDRMPHKRLSADLTRAVDRLQARYGTDSISYGARGKKLDAFGTKIAFTRVPALEEFDY
jgi:DNA polymerase-4